MLELKGKRILLIALRGYSNGILKKMYDMGAQVDYLNDKPNDGFLCKTLGRLKVKSYISVINKYYRQVIENMKENQYDYILVIRGEYTPVDTLKLLKYTFKEAKLILYMWDSIKNNRYIDRTWEYYDKVYTFDRIDYLNNKDRIEFLPLYYYEDYLPDKSNDIVFKYDIAFIGTGHEDRVKIAKRVQMQCEEEGRKCFMYLFLPHKLIFLYNKMFNNYYKNVKIKDVCFCSMPFAEAYKIYSESKCVMDIESSSQNGLTMRTIEMIGLRKKLITTNKDIVNYDFYNQNNILVVDRKNFVLDFSFLDKPYIDLDEAIYQKYSLSNWIMEVLK